MSRITTRRKLSYEEPSSSSCSLCHGHHVHFSTPATWKSKEAQSYVLSLKITENDLICAACRKDIARVLNDSAYVPRWIEKSSVTTCCIVSCLETVFASLNQASGEQLHNIFETLGLETEANLSNPTPLCKKHYHLVYNILKSTQTQCVTCGVSLRHCKHKVCPNPKIVERFLTENTEYDGQINDHDKVCYTCYRAHLEIIKLDSEISRDEDLQDLITELEDMSKATGIVNSVEEAIDISTTRIIVYVAYKLLDRKGLLLTHVHDLLCQQISELIVAHQLEKDNTSISSLVTVKWVLSSLTATLTKHMAYSCKVRKYGTLIYRPHADLRPALAEALWRAHKYSKHDVPAPQKYSNADQKSETQTGVLHQLNAKLNSQIKALLAKNSVSPMEHDNVDIDLLIDGMDPELWKAITVLTMSTSERRGTSKVLDPTSQANHVWKIRRLFLLCTMMFITDDRCSVPMHILIADLVESQGASGVLHRMLNQIGVCASQDTLSRFMQHKVTNSNLMTDMYLCRDSFSIVSADNIDFLHKHARSYKGKDNTSWHGTTVQVVQPLPSLSVFCSMSCDLEFTHGNCVQQVGTEKAVALKMREQRTVKTVQTVN